MPHTLVLIDHIFQLIKTFNPIVKQLDTKESVSLGEENGPRGSSMRVSYIDIIALFSLDDIEIPNPMAHRYYIHPRAFSFFRKSCCTKLYVFHYLSKLHMNDRLATYGSFQCKMHSKLYIPNIDILTLGCQINEQGGKSASRVTYRKKPTQRQKKSIYSQPYSHFFHPTRLFGTQEYIGYHFFFFVTENRI